MRSLRIPGIAFIDGITTGHTCKWDGDAVFVSASGKIIHWHTYRQWASYPGAARERLIYEHHNRIEDPIAQGGATCSICKAMFNPVWDIHL